MKQEPAMLFGDGHTDHRPPLLRPVPKRLEMHVVETFGTIPCDLRDSNELLFLFPISRDSAKIRKRDKPEPKEQSHFGAPMFLLIVYIICILRRGVATFT